MRRGLKISLSLICLAVGLWVYAFVFLAPGRPIKIQHLQAQLLSSKALPKLDYSGLPVDLDPAYSILLVEFETPFSFEKQGAVPQNSISRCNADINLIGRPSSYVSGSYMFRLPSVPKTQKNHYGAVFVLQSSEDELLLAEDEHTGIPVSRNLCFRARSQNMFTGYRQSRAISVGGVPPIDRTPR